MAASPTPAARSTAAAGLALLVFSMFALAASAARGESTDRYPEATEVFHCSFGPDSDVNLDRWPTGWSRLKDAGHPSYLKIELDDEAGPDGDSSLKVELNGGGATIYSPNVPVESRYAYVLETWIKTSGLQRDDAFLTLIFQDDEGHRLEVARSETIRVTEGWKLVRLGPVVPPTRNLSQAVVGLHVEPADGQDIQGEVWFDDVWLARMARIELVTNDPQNLFTDPAAVKLRCVVSGVGEAAPRLKVEVTDPFGKPIEQALLDVEITTKKTDRQNGPRQEVSDTRSVTWQPTQLKYGFYRVRGTLVAGDRDVHERVLNLAVVRPQVLAARGNFGWSFPHGMGPIDRARAVDLLRQTGVNWVKLPLWYEAERQDDFDESLWMIDRLNSFGIQTIGMLSSPPTELLKLLNIAGGRAAPLFSRDPAEWFAAFEPTLLRLSLRVPQWQLGFDDDRFVDDADLERHVAAIKAQMDRVTHDVQLAIGWNWAFEPPAETEAPWRARVMSAWPECTAEELKHYLLAKGEDSAEQWVNVAPLPASQYALADRATDLVERLAAAKMHGADRIFLPDPFDPETGLLDAQGSPSELYLPWRSMALTLSGAEYAGAVSLPQGSHNHVFARNGRAVMLVWNPVATRETLYLGDEIEQRDLWGGDIPIETAGAEQSIEVGPIPSLVLGIDEAVAHTQSTLRFEPATFSSILDVPQRASLHLENHFPQRLNGSLTIVGPEAWRISPRRVEVSLGPGESMIRPIDVTLGYDAEVGPQRVRLDFEVTSGKRYGFSVLRTIEVGAADVDIELTTRLNASGQLEVEQRMENRTKQAMRFKCDLFAPGRRHQRVAMTLSAGGSGNRVVHFPDGQALVGETLRLRAVEVGGPRVLNVRVVAEP